MDVYKQNLSNEVDELDSKIARLDSLIAGEQFGRLSCEGRFLLRSQREAMSLYSRVLHRRVELLNCQ